MVCGKKENSIVTFWVVIITSKEKEPAVLEWTTTAVKIHTSI